MGWFSNKKKINHNTLNHLGQQAATKRLKATKPESVSKLPKGKGTVQYPSAKQQRKARWS
jgi:hypothetical protein